MSVIQWLSIWRLTPHNRHFLQSIGREDLIQRAEPLRALLEEGDEQRAFLARLEDQNITTLESFLSDIHHKACQRAQEP